MISEVDLLIKELPIFLKKYGKYPRQVCDDKEEQKLANRVNRVRQRAKLKERKRNYVPLTKSEIDKLKKIGFIFDATRRSWLDIVVEELPKFVAKFGRYPLLTSDNKEERSLAQIVYRVRARANMTKPLGKLNPYTREELQKLEQINFVFDATRKTELDMVLDELPDFVTRYGRYPSTHSADVEEIRLAKRVAYVRKRAKISTPEGVYKPLTEEDRRMLDDINFAYNTKENKIKIEEFLNINTL